MNFFDYTSLEDIIPHGLTLLERIVPLLLLAVIIYLLIHYKDRLQNISQTRIIDIVLGSMMLFGELSYMAWNFYHSQFDRVNFFSTLPFHLCSYAIWGTMITLFFKVDKVYKTVFVFSVISILALLFPNLNHGINSFRYYQLYFSHSLILISLVYLYSVKGYKPTKKDLKDSFIILQIIIVISLIVNVTTNSEFLFIGPGNKPIDFAWEWPWHMIQYEIVMVLFYLGVYYYLSNLLKQKMD